MWQKEAALLLKVNLLPLQTALTRTYRNSGMLIQRHSGSSGDFLLQSNSNVVTKKPGLHLIFWASSNIYICGRHPKCVQWTKARTNRFKPGPPPRDVWGRQDMEMSAKRWGMGEEGCIHVQTNTSLEFYTALRCSVFGFQAALQY